MVFPLLIPVAGALLDIVTTGIAIWSNYETSKDIDGKVSQIESLMEALAGQMSFSEFVSSCWLIIAFFIGVFYLCILVAFPKQSRQVSSVKGSGRRMS